MSVNLMSAIFETEFFDLKDEAGNVTKASTAKLVLLALADHANDEGEGAYPSVERLCRKTALSEQTIRNTFDALRYNGILYLEGRSKYGTNNHTINTKSFPKAIGKEVTVLTLYPLGGQMGNVEGSNEYLNTPHRLDPNHHINTKETPRVLSTDELQGVYSLADKTMDTLLQFEEQAKQAEAEGKAWRGRELLSDSYLPYGDWWHKKTGLHMYAAKGKPKINSMWMKEFQTWWENELTIEVLDQAFTAEIDWRKVITHPRELTAKAIALASAPVQVKSPEQSEGKGFYA